MVLPKILVLSVVSARHQAAVETDTSSAQRCKAAAATRALAPSPDTSMRAAGLVQAACVATMWSQAQKRTMSCTTKINRYEIATLDCDSEFQGAHRVLWQLQSTFSLQVACAAPAPNSRPAHLYCSSARPKPAGAAVQYASTTCTAESDAHLWEAAHGGAHVNALESLSSCAKGSAGTHRAGGTQHTRLLVHGTAGVTIPTPEA